MEKNTRFLYKVADVLSLPLSLLEGVIVQPIISWLHLWASGSHVVDRLQSTTNHRQISKISKTGDLPLGNQADHSGLAQFFDPFRTEELVRFWAPKKTIPFGGKCQNPQASPVSEMKKTVWNHTKIFRWTIAIWAIWAIRRCETHQTRPDADSWRLLCRVLFQLCSQWA